MGDSAGEPRPRKRQHRRAAGRRTLFLWYDGVGSIFAAYSDGILADDDEVAVMHAPKSWANPP